MKYEDDFSHIEESDYFYDQKVSRKERKLTSKLDRSKYKKTDQNKQNRIKEMNYAKVSENKELLKGLVIKIHGQEIFIDTQEKIFICSLRGALKKEKQRKKNLIVVGDYVLFEGIDESHGVIASVLDRKSALSRAHNLDHQKEHFIATNVDQVLITISVMDPPLRPPIIDRFIIAAKKGDLRPIIVCNKIDLLTSDSFSKEEKEEQENLMKECKKIYTNLGIPFLLVSNEKGLGLEDLINVMNGKISVFSGQSGSGKSSLINSLTSLQLRIGSTVQSSRKGAHTTSHTELLKLPFNGYVVDTPGIKSFGVWNLTPSELKDYFFELSEHGKNCKFLDCFHRGEVGCAIPEAIENGLISTLRYNSYINILKDLESKHKRR